MMDLDNSSSSEGKVRVLELSVKENTHRRKRHQLSVYALDPQSRGTLLRRYIPFKIR